MTWCWPTSVKLEIVKDVSNCVAEIGNSKECNCVAEIGDCKECE